MNALRKLSPDSRTSPAPPPDAAVQATMAAAIDAVEGAAMRIRVAEESALSLAQRERLEVVAADLESTGDTLRWHLGPQARCLLQESSGWGSRLMRRLRRVERGNGERGHAAPWADALADAVAALEDAGARMATLAGCISEQMDASLLARSVARRLRDHRDMLLRGADRWGHAA